MSVRACRIMPCVFGVLVHEHTVHGGAGVRLAGTPARKRHLLQMMLRRPHPLSIPGNVITTCPPAFGFFKCYNHNTGIEMHH